MNTKNKIMKTWIPVNADSDFSIYNIPFGICLHNGKQFVASIVGDTVIDLDKAHQLGVFEGIGIDANVLTSEYLNDFIDQGKAITNEVRLRLQASLCDDDSALIGSDALIPVSEVEHTMPVYVRDYTDFYSSIEHATNLGIMFRGPENALMPNWRHIPVGYHGRASSIVVSGKDFKRPKGQQKPLDAPPVYGPCKRLDFELEMAFVVGKSTQIGDTISTDNASDHIFGLTLFNDWSARDIQKWEYVPLGPFLGKNFASHVSPWIVTLEALEPFKVDRPIQEPAVLPYLEYKQESNYDIHLQVSIQPEASEEKVISNSNFKYMYWCMQQQLAHHTVNGCNVNVGDMMASGTISGPTEDSCGSLIEMTKAGKVKLDMPDGSQRTFLEDGDSIIMRGHAEKDGMRVGFGEVRAKVLPAD